MIAKVVKMCICMIMKVIEMYKRLVPEGIELRQRPGAHVFEFRRPGVDAFFARRGFPVLDKKKDRRGRSKHASRFEQSQSRESPESEMDVETPQENV